MTQKSHQDMKAQEDVNTPMSRKAKLQHGKPDQLKEKLKEAENRQEALIDEAVEETMDASDPPSPKHIT